MNRSYEVVTVRHKAKGDYDKEGTPRWKGAKDAFDHEKAHKTEMRLVGIKCPKKADFPAFVDSRGQRQIINWELE